MAHLTQKLKGGQQSPTPRERDEFKFELNALGKLVTSRKKQMKEADVIGKYVLKKSKREEAPRALTELPPAYGMLLVMKTALRRKMDMNTRHSAERLQVTVMFATTFGCLEGLLG